MTMTETHAQDHLAGLFAAACGMLSLCIAGGDDAPARAAAQLVLHFEPPPEVLARLAQEAPAKTLFEPATTAAMRQLARSVIAGRPSPTQN